MLILKPQDIAVLLKIIAIKDDWTVTGLAQTIYLSASETHAALSRAAQARLFDSRNRLVKLENLQDFMFHGLQYVFLSTQGGLTRGMPTSIAAPPLQGKHFDEPEIPPVWPHPMGLKRGYSFEPLYKNAPDAASADYLFYELLALTDALREGTSRIRTVATAELKDRFAQYSLYANRSI